MLGALAVTAIGAGAVRQADACTAITLGAIDGSYIQARTQEWGAFDLNSNVLVTPRDMEFQSKALDGSQGLSWTSKYGVVGLDLFNLRHYADGLNEQGLTVSVLFLPGTTEFPTYDPELSQQSIDPADLAMWLLTSFANIDEVRAELPNVQISPRPMPALDNTIPPIHWLISDATGNTVVVEYYDKELHIFDNPVGVLTNSPEFPWHLTNLRNYIGLSAAPHDPIEVGDLNLEPLGVGTGMLGLPGDFSPPSRFVRAVALRNTARPLSDGEDAMSEAFRILNSFDIPIGATDVPGMDIIGSTQWTTVSDSKALNYYYTTQFNSRVRLVDLTKVDFTKEDFTIVPIDAEPKQDTEEVVFN